MSKVTFITGGARSGKSCFAMQVAEQNSHHPVYLATARIWDDDFAKRVERHQKDRGKSWQTIEEEKNLSCHDFTGKTVVVDCITLWLTNIFYDNNYDVSLSLKEAKEEWMRLIAQNADFIVVSNELGMGIHPIEESGRKFGDLQGWMNQFIAGQADTVYLMVSGIPVKIKAEDKKCE